jgi:SAM-dependent methyltransferase
MKQAWLGDYSWASMLKGFMEGLSNSADRLNRHNILSMADPTPRESLCDLGCDDGVWTLEVARAYGCRKLYGVEIVPERAEQARARGIEVAVSDLVGRFPYEDGSMDVVHANQVIEHMTDVDNFMAEIKRVLRVGGVAIVSTENGSSWHNIFAALMGWQIFSATNISKLTGGLGNPMAIHRGNALELSSWTHKTIFNYRGLKELAEVHGLKVVKVMGAGYHPLPPSLGRSDVRHAHFLALKAVKVGPGAAA